MNIRDLLLGMAIGDAFGAGVEFQDRRWIKENVDFSRFVNARHQIPQNEVPSELFTNNYHAWDYTDDTETTLGVMRAIMAPEEFTPDSVMKHLSAEYMEMAKKRGFGRNGYGSLRWVFEGEKSIDEVRKFQGERPNPGNAPTVRAVPLGFLPKPSIYDSAIINADATHPHDIARASSYLVAEAARHILIEEEDPMDLPFLGMNRTAGLDNETAFRMGHISQLPPPDQLSESQYRTLCGPQPIQAPYFPAGIYGIPSDARQTAVTIVYLLMHARSAFEGLKWSVLMGGDVDSLAAVCTGILACQYGLDSLPDYMLKNVEGKDHLIASADRFEAYLQEIDG